MNMRGFASYIVPVLLMTGFAGISPAAAENAQALQSFQSKTGHCTPAERGMLKDKSGNAGFTVTISEAPVYVESGLAPAETGIRVPPMTGFRCHARDGDKILVSSEDSDICGWIVQASALAGKRSDPAKGGVLDRALAGAEVCGVVEPLSITEFCERREALNRPARECKFPWIAKSPFETKFLVWNAHIHESLSEAERLEVPLYRSSEAEPGDALGKVKIFNVLRVFDVKPGGKSLRYLVGANEKRLEGWIDQKAGAIWYSKLTVFFARKGDKQVMALAPTADKNTALAQKPDNLKEMLAGRQEFRRYPVLVDNRERKRTDPPGKKPYLEIAYIGQFCGKGKLCSAAGPDGGGVTPDQNIMQRADIVFLIDATKSMKPYFGLVSRAVRDVAADYAGTPDYQFGVVLYGDHKVKGQTHLDDPLDVRHAVELQPLKDGTEFDRLKDEPMYLIDAQGDKEEAPQAALLWAINNINWRGLSPALSSTSQTAATACRCRVAWSPPCRTNASSTSRWPCAVATMNASTVFSCGNRAKSCASIVRPRAFLWASMCR